MIHIVGNHCEMQGRVGLWKLFGRQSHRMCTCTCSDMQFVSDTFNTSLNKKRDDDQYEVQKPESRVLNRISHEVHISKFQVGFYLKNQLNAGRKGEGALLTALSTAVH